MKALKDLSEKLNQATILRKEIRKFWKEVLGKFVYPEQVQAFVLIDRVLMQYCINVREQIDMVKEILEKEDE